jgi:predicted Rossmann fold flavoprotein
MTAPDCLILGAGAAGCFAAIHIKETCPDATVWVVEAGARPLQKVKISGGGRCNVTHHCFDLERFAAAYPRGARQMRHQLRAFGPADTVAWFKARGVALKAEPDGRMFPTTDDSQTIIDCLLGEMRRLGVRLILNTHVQAITPTPSTGGYTLRLTSPHLADTLHVPRLVAGGVQLSGGEGRQFQRGGATQAPVG